MNSQPSIRPIFLLGFLMCTGMIGVALFAQYYLLMDPCPLCIFARVATMAVGAVFLLGALHNPSGTTGRRIYGQLLVLTSLGGIVITGRHSYLQHLPPEQVPSCGPGLSYWMDNLPAFDVLSKVFQGSGECAEVSWSMFGLSIPEWTLAVFAVFMIYGLKVLIKGR